MRASSRFVAFVALGGAVALAACGGSGTSPVASTPAITADSGSVTSSGNGPGGPPSPVPSSGTGTCTNDCDGTGQGPGPGAGNGSGPANGGGAGNGYGPGPGPSDGFCGNACANRPDLPPDVRSVFTNLQRASLENHLPAFERCQ